MTDASMSLGAGDRRSTWPDGAHGLPPGTRRVHFVGVGGIGMSGVAVMMSAFGYDVTGSDIATSAVTTRLCQLGIAVQTGHDARWVGQADALVVSAAVAEDNPEVREARRRCLPVIPRGVMLAGLTRSSATVAVTGTHGKSTTASMVAVMLAECGLDPSAVIGAHVGAFGGNTRIGRGDHFVVEADESEPSLLELTPRVAVVTNLEEEHLDHYGTFDRLRDTVVGFVNRVVPSGSVVLCADDPELSRLRDRIAGRVVTYGIEDGTAGIVGEEPVYHAGGSCCRVCVSRGGHSTDVRLNVGIPGRHNLLNALGAFTVGLEMGLLPDRVVSALANFDGVDRRFELKGEVDGMRVVDDYAHHPTEVAAVLATARSQPHERLIAVFQPHRFSRTARCFEEFARVLSVADVVVLTDIFAAGESPIPGVTAGRLADAVRQETDRPVRHAGTLDEVLALVSDLARSGDLIVTLGAGSIGGLGERLLAARRKAVDAERQRGSENS